MTNHEEIIRSKKNNRPLVLFVLVVELVALSIAKIAFYYSFMDVGKVLPLLTAITFIVLLLMFGVFKRKWIFAIIYMVISLVMLVDAHYFSFFNRMATVTALGTVDLLTGVVESVKQVIMPSTLLLLVDATLILVLCFFRRRISRADTDESNEDMALMQEKVMMPTWLSRTKSLYNKTLKLKIRMISLLILFLFLSCLILIVPKPGSAATSIFTQEFFSFHLRDLTGNTISDEFNSDSTEILLMEGNYDVEKDGELFGVAEGMNLILIQVESMQDFVINRTYEGQEITPFLNSLLKEDSVHFDSCYFQTGIGNTSDAEFAVNNSLFGTMESYTYKLYEDNYFKGLPILLRDLGYETMAFHAYEPEYWNRENAYVGQGFDKFYSQEDYNVFELLGMGLSDYQFLTQSVSKLAEAKDPFYGFIITLSSHYPYDIQGKLTLKSEDMDTLFGNYLESMSYVDYAIKAFVDKLKENGLYDNTMIVIYGDHIALNPSVDEVKLKMTDFLGDSYNFNEAMNIPLIVHIPQMGEAKTISTVGGQIDFLPTIAYLMGFESLDTIYFGHNLCTIEDNFVPLRTYAPKGSFVTGDTMFMMSKSGEFDEAKAINIRTNEEVSTEGFEEDYLRACALFNTSDYYLKNDILKRVLLDGDDFSTIIDEANRGLGR